MKRFAWIVSILLVIFFAFAALPAFAQEATPEPTAELTAEAAVETATEESAAEIATEEVVVDEAAEEPAEGVQGGSLAVLLIGLAAIVGVIGFVMVRDGVIGKRN